MWVKFFIKKLPDKVIMTSLLAKVSLDYYQTFKSVCLCAMQFNLAISMCTVQWAEGYKVYSVRLVMGLLIWWIKTSYIFRPKVNILKVINAND